MIQRRSPNSQDHLHSYLYQKKIRNHINTFYFTQDIYDGNLGLAKYDDDFENRLPICFEILLVSHRLYNEARSLAKYEYTRQLRQQPQLYKDSHLRKRNTQTYSRVGVVALRPSRTKLPQHVRLMTL